MKKGQGTSTPTANKKTMGNTHVSVGGAQVPRELQNVWAAKQDVIVSQGGTRIDLHGGDKDMWNPKHLSLDELNKVTDTLVASLVHHKVTSINVAKCKKLTDSSITVIAKGCPELKELKVGGIANLTDSSMKAIAQGCPELKKLCVTWCRLGDSWLPAICEGCSRLEELRAWDSGLVSVPEEIGDRLPLLQVLDIDGNSVSALPASICKLKDLRDLDVVGNPLQSPPKEIAYQGLDAIKRYFEEVSKGSSISKLLKVVLVGDGEAGKTSLRNALAGRPNPRQEDRTIHLDIEKIPLSADLDINVYDCGGQEEYLATQLPYLTGLALYMIVVDAQYAIDEHAHELEDKLHRFLVILQNRVPGAVILPIVTKVDTVADAERRCQWLERKIENWLQDTRKAVCCDRPDSSSNCPQPAQLAPATDGKDTRYADSGDMHNFIPLRVQLPALAVSVADKDDMRAVSNSVRAVRDRIIALTKHNPPLLRGVGQQIPSAYMTVLKLFGAITEYGDDNCALEALRNDTALALGEVSELSPDGTYRPKDKLEKIWNTYRDGANVNVEGDVFDDAIHLWEAQGLIFVDAGLVVLQPEFMTTIVRPLVDHRLNDENAYGHFEEVVATFLESNSPRDIDSYNQLIEALDIFRTSGEFDCPDKSLFLSFLWRETGLHRSHYDRVLQMLAKCCVIIMGERDAGERHHVVVVPFRLPKKPDQTKLERFWPKSLFLNERELKLRFGSSSGFPTGLAERFVTDVHGLGTSLYSWRTGVVLKACAGYSVLTERRENELHFTVRFESNSTDDVDAAWKALCKARHMLVAQREYRFPGLFYKERFVCEACCLEQRDRVSTERFDATKMTCVFRSCGHHFDLKSKGKRDDAPVNYNFHEAVSNVQLVARTEGNANYHSNARAIT